MYYTLESRTRCRLHDLDPMMRCVGMWRYGLLNMLDRVYGMYIRLYTQLILSLTLNARGFIIDLDLFTSLPPHPSVVKMPFQRDVNGLNLFSPLLSRPSSWKKYKMKLR